MAINLFSPAYSREASTAEPAQLTADLQGSVDTARPPTYSTQPRDDEEIIAHTPRPGVSPSRGNFTMQWPQATLIFKDQENDARLPTYGRGGRILGELGLKSTERVIRVTLKLSGQMSLSVADSGASGIMLVAETQVLWKQPSAETPTQQRCPSVLPICIQFPYTYETEGKRWRLPPSFEATFLGIPALFVRCIYTLSITIYRRRTYHLASWNTSKTYVTMLKFRPRTRPNRPIVLLDSVFESIKPVPEEWLQVVAQMSVRAKSQMKPIECHLLIPSNQTFAISEPIPFHLQLRSSLESMHELFPPSSSHLQPPDAKQDKYYTENPRSEVGALRVCIARQVVVEVNGRRRFKTFTVGQAKLYAVPPVFPDGKRDCLDEVYLDWKGEVKCWSEVTCGGFSAGNLLVKDFVVLSLTPPNPRTSFLVPLQLSQPIRLVTDSWIDVDPLHPGDV